MVTFTPTAAGPATGTLSVTDNAPGSPQPISLNGTGGTPNLGLAVGPFSSLTATVTAGNPAQYGLLIGGQGIGGTATVTCTDAPTGVACGVPPTTTLSATTAAPLDVGVSTTARSHLFPIPLHAVPGSWYWQFSPACSSSKPRPASRRQDSVGASPPGTRPLCLRRFRLQFQWRHPSRYLHAGNHRQIGLRHSNPEPHPYRAVESCLLPVTILTPRRNEPLDRAEHGRSLSPVRREIASNNNPSARIC